MNRFLRTFLIILAMMVAITSMLSNVLSQNRRQIEKLTPEELALMLVPDFQIKIPNGKGPFPTILGFHGGAGIGKGLTEWQDYFVELGYATILVDSNKSRGYSDEDIKGARRASIPGIERAGDVLVSLIEARKLAFVDRDKVAFIGWSNGAWAIMDLLAMDPPKELPANLKNVPGKGLEGLKAAVLFYPYCYFPAKALINEGWTQDIDVLMLLAGKDSRVPLEPCLAIVGFLESKGKPIQSHVYPSADHAFDRYYEGNEKVSLSHDPELTKDARERVKHFLAKVF